MPTVTIWIPDALDASLTELSKLYHQTLQAMVQYVLPRLTATDLVQQAQHAVVDALLDRLDTPLEEPAARQRFLQGLLTELGPSRLPMSWLAGIEPEGQEGLATLLARERQRQEELGVFAAGHRCGDHSAACDAS